MAASVKIGVLLPDGTPARGAQVIAKNHDAWLKKHQDWHGTTGEGGIFQWPNMDTGARGDRYTFTVAYTDLNGTRWAGESSQRISGDTEIIVTLHKV